MQFQGPSDAILMASATITADTSYPVPTVYDACESVLLLFNVTGITGGAPTVRLVIEIFDVAQDAYMTTSIATATVATTGAYVYAIGKTSFSGVTGSIVMPVPRSWRVKVDLGGTITNVTASLSICGLRNEQ